MKALLMSDAEPDDAVATDTLDDAMIAKRYLRVVGFTAAGCLLLVAAMNWTIDPFGAYGHPVESLSAYKEQVGSRTGKAELYGQGEYDTVLLGTSRVEVGFDTADEEFSGWKVCNLGLAGTNLYETKRVFDYIMDERPPERVVLFLDFLQFTDGRTTSRDFDKSRFSGAWSTWEYHLENLVSARAATASLQALTASLRGRASGYTTDGHLDVTRKKSTTRQDRLVAKTITGFLNRPDSYARYVYSPERLEMLRGMLHTCREREVEVLVAIPPVHALQLETIAAAGLTETFWNWKRDVAEIVATELDGRVTAWDFTNYSEYNTERVVDGEHDEAMQWFWESSHFRPSLGRRVIARLREFPDADPTLGVELTPKSIDRLMVQAETDRMSWQREQAGDAAWFAALPAVKKRVPQIASAGDGPARY